MTITRLGRRTLLAVLVVLGSLTNACRGSGEEIPPVTSAAAQFFQAWEAGDYEAMAAGIDRSAGSGRPAGRLGRSLRRTLRRGRITAVDVRRSGIPSHVGPKVADVPYEISYTSEVAEDPVVLKGRLRFSYDESDASWKAKWTKADLWPGIAKAASFEILYDWPRRASVFDRNGRVLARGPAGARTYPFGSVGGSVIGHIGTLTKKNSESAPRSRIPGDLYGASGLERAFEGRLGGSPGTQLVIRNARGKTAWVLDRVRTEPGRRVRTTIDIDVQAAAERALGSTTGGAAVLEPSTGDVLAVVGSGAFNPQLHVGASDVQPFNRGLSGLYPPGSSLKVMTAAAALDSDTVTPNTRLSGPSTYKGVRNFESGEFGTIDFGTALKFSVNTAFAQVAEKLGTARLTRYARSFGFNRRPRMPLRAATSSFPRPADLGDLMWSSIGQARVLATPLQMASIAATVANDGKRMEPRVMLARAIQAKQVISARTAAQLNGLMQSVVRGGTGTRARIGSVSVAGKTGTAEVDVGGVRRNHAWFIAFAPAEAPRVAIAVVAEYGGVGGEVAAPIARDLLTRVLRAL